MSKKSIKFESNPFKVIFNGFSALFKYNQTLAIIILVLTAFGQFGQSFNYSFGGATEATSDKPELGAAIAAIIGIVFIILLPLIIFFGTMVNGFISFVAYKTSKGETTEFGDALRVVWKKFWTILWIEIIVFLKVFGGILLFIIPGVRAMMRYDMVLFPVFEDDASASEAIAKSKAITKNHLIEIFGMNVAAGIIPFVGQTFHVGGQSVMYPQLRDLHKSGGEKPKVHWLNYLAFFIFGGILLLVLLIVLLFVAFGA